MEISFKSNKLKKIFDSERQLVKKYGQACARKIISRLDDMLAATCLEVLRTLPGRCHELKGDKKGQLSLDVEQPLRLIFKPSNPDVKLKEDGGLDWNSVNAVEIVGVEDTHE